jgi:hypothetical protein
VDSLADTADEHAESSYGTSLLPRDLTEDELTAAPVLESADALLIDGLTVDEDDLFAAALSW